MKATKRRIFIQAVIDQPAKIGLESASEALGMKPHVVANRVLNWVM